jgi:hypothetical protein
VLVVAFSELPQRLAQFFEVRKVGTHSNCPFSVRVKHWQNLASMAIVELGFSEHECEGRNLQINIDDPEK